MSAYVLLNLLTLVEKKAIKCEAFISRVSALIH